VRKVSELEHLYDCHRDTIRQCGAGTLEVQGRIRIVSESPRHVIEGEPRLQLLSIKPGQHRLLLPVVDPDDDVSAVAEVA
jgi:hypothetical protein